MESRRSESAPANVATEIMQPAVIKVSPSLLADLNPLVTTAPLARIRKPKSAEPLILQLRRRRHPRRRKQVLRFPLGLARLEAPYGQWFSCRTTRRA